MIHRPLEASEAAGLSAVLDKMAAASGSDSDDVMIAQELVKQANLSASSGAGESIKLGLMISAANAVYSSSTRDAGVYDVRMLQELAKLDSSKLSTNEASVLATALEGMQANRFNHAENAGVSAMVAAINETPANVASNPKLDILKAYLAPSNTSGGGWGQNANSAILAQLRRLDATRLSSAEADALKDIAGLMAKIQGSDSDDAGLIAALVTQANKEGGAGNTQFTLMTQTARGIYHQSTASASFEDRNAIETLGALSSTDTTEQELNELNTLLTNQTSGRFSAAELAALRGKVSQISPSTVLPGVTPAVIPPTSGNSSEWKETVLSAFLTSTGRTAENLTVAQSQIFNLLKNLDPSKLNQNEATKLAGIAGRVGSIAPTTANNNTNNTDDMEIVRLLVNEANRTRGNSASASADEAKFNLMLQVAQQIYGDGPAPATNAGYYDNLTVKTLAGLNTGRLDSTEIATLRGWVDMIGPGHKNWQSQGPLNVLVATANETALGTGPNIKLDMLAGYMRAGFLSGAGNGGGKWGVIGELRKLDVSKLTSTEADMLSGLLTTMGGVRAADNDDIGIMKTLVDEINKKPSANAQETLKLGLMVHSTARLYAAQAKDANYDDRGAIDVLASIDANQLSLSEAQNLLTQFGAGVTDRFDVNEVTALREVVNSINSTNAESLGSNLFVAVREDLNSAAADIAAGDVSELFDTLGREITRRRWYSGIDEARENRLQSDPVEAALSSPFYSGIAQQRLQSATSSSSEDFADGSPGDGALEAALRSPFYSNLVADRNRRNNNNT